MNAWPSSGGGLGKGPPRSRDASATEQSADFNVLAEAAGLSCGSAASLVDGLVGAVRRFLAGVV